MASKSKENAKIPGKLGLGKVLQNRLLTEETVKENLRHIERRIHQDRILFWNTTTAVQGALLVAAYEVAWCFVGVMMCILKIYLTCNQKTSTGTAQKNASIMLHKSCFASGTFITLVLWLLGFFNSLILLGAVIERNFIGTKFWYNVTSGILAIKLALWVGFLLSLAYENPCEIIPSYGIIPLPAANCRITWPSNYWNMFKVADINIYSIFAMFSVVITMIELSVVEFFMDRLEVLIYAKHATYAIYKIPVDLKGRRDKRVRDTEFV